MRRIGRLAVFVASVIALFAITVYAEESPGTPGENKKVKPIQKEAVWTAEMIDNGIAYENGKIRENPNDADAYNSRAHFYFMKVEFDKALADYNKALEIKPDYIIVYNNRGLLYEKMGDLAKAIADFSKIIELEPNGINAYSAYRCRAQIFSKVHQDIKAQEDLEKAEKLKNTFVQ